MLKNGILSVGWSIGTLCNCDHACLSSNVKEMMVMTLLIMKLIMICSAEHKNISCQLHVDAVL